MAQPKYYSPAIRRFLVSVLYHEARRRKIPMTELVNEILEAELMDSPGWRLACEERNKAENTQLKQPKSLPLTVAA